MNDVSIRWFLAWLIATAMVFGMHAHAAEGESSADPDGQDEAGGGENASNPLAAVSSTDLRWQYLDLNADGLHLNDYFVDGVVGLGSDRIYDWALDSNISKRGQV